MRYSTRLIALLSLHSIVSMAQNTTSPYSILGVGDIDTKDYGKLFGMGSTAIAMRSETYINLTNPASLTSLDANMLNIDINVRYRSSSFQYPTTDTATTSYSDAAIRRLSLTFNPGKRWGLSFGLKPYSTVNYLLSNKIQLDGSDSKINRTTDGSGGINNVYLSSGFRITKNLSVGITGSYLFGSTNRSTQYTYEALGVNINRAEYKEFRGMQATIGMQYEGKITERISQQFGFIFTNATNIKTTSSSEYIESDSSVVTSKINTTNFNLPMQLGIGYAIILDSRTTIAADYKIYDWQRQKLDYPNAYTGRASRFSLGFQHTTLTYKGGSAKEKFFFQAGLAMEQGYLKINNKSLNEISASVGIGANLTRLVNCYIGFELGKKGSLEYSQIKENFSQLSFGITLKEMWRNTRQIKKYD